MGELGGEVSGARRKGGSEAREREAPGTRGGVTRDEGRGRCCNRGEGRRMHQGRSPGEEISEKKGGDVPGERKATGTRGGGMREKKREDR